MGGQYPRKPSTEQMRPGIAVVNEFYGAKRLIKRKFELRIEILMHIFSGQNLFHLTFDYEELNRVDRIIAKQIDISLVDSISPFRVKNNPHFD